MANARSEEVSTRMEDGRDLRQTFTHPGMIDLAAYEVVIPDQPTAEIPGSKSPRVPCAARQSGGDGADDAQATRGRDAASGMQHFMARPADDVFAFHVPNGGGRSAIEAAILKGLGVRGGVPDVIAIKGGRTYGLELKVPGGRVSDVQAETMQAMTRAGVLPSAL